MKESTRIDFDKINQETLKPLYILGNHLRSSNIEEVLQLLIEIRVSQINGCAWCLDMHWKDARALGQSEQRLYGLSAWKESPYYTDRERAALLWAEAVTACKVPDSIFEQVSPYFSEQDLIDLTMVVNGINVWNRLNIAFPKKVIGTYQPGQYHHVNSKAN